jgi:hypothetical protein
MAVTLWDVQRIFYRLRNGEFLYYGFELEG